MGRWGWRDDFQPIKDAIGIITSSLRAISRETEDRDDFPNAFAIASGGAKFCDKGRPCRVAFCWLGYRDVLGSGFVHPD